MSQFVNAEVKGSDDARIVRVEQVADKHVREEGQKRQTNFPAFFPCTNRWLPVSGLRASVLSGSMEGAAIDPGHAFPPPGMIIVPLIIVMSND